MLPLLYILLATQGGSANTLYSPRATAEKNVMEIAVSASQLQIPTPKECCYKDSTVPHGTVVSTVPEGCAQLQCLDGCPVIVFIDSPTDKGCCEFGGHLYPDGSELPGICLKIVCKGGQWKYEAGKDGVDDCCVPCHLTNDPHIKTFDKYRYDWHGTCNYSVAQSDLTFEPEVGVFSDFRPCGRASCLDCTTFRDNPNTILSFCYDNIFQGTVNGNIYIIPGAGIIQLGTVLAFRGGSCAVFVGSSGLVVRHCQSRLDILAHPLHFEHLDGLCGHYNQYRQDDFTSRADVVFPLQYYPVLFPLSWKTNEQENKLCNEPCPEPHVCKDTGAAPIRDGTTSPCKAKARGTKAYLDNIEQCTTDLKPIVGKLVDFDGLVENCADDLCVFEEGEATVDDIREVRRLTIQLNCEGRKMEDALKGEETNIGSCVKYAAAAVLEETTTTTRPIDPIPPKAVQKLGKSE